MSNLLDLDLQKHDIDHDLEILYGVHPVLDLDPSIYPGGIAMWGALPAPFDTSICEPDEGVHVHARKETGGKKSIDATFSSVRVHLKNSEGRPEQFLVSGDDAVAYGIGNILKRKIKYLKCPNCNSVHSDRGWHAVNYHQTHDCEACSIQFGDTEPSISNPIMYLKELCGDVLQERKIVDPVERIISVKQEKFKYGTQLWGSNPALVWTSTKLEEGGIHFHGFFRKNHIPTVDETYGILDVDGILLDPEMVRHMMVLMALEHLRGSVTTVYCPKCDNTHFDSFDDAITPHVHHSCEHCGASFSSENAIISNPLVETFESFYKTFGDLFPEKETPNRIIT